MTIDETFTNLSMSISFGESFDIENASSLSNNDQKTSAASTSQINCAKSVGKFE